MTDAPTATDVDLFGVPTYPESPLQPSAPRWVPTVFVDEITPAPRASPDEWLTRDGPRLWLSELNIGEPTDDEMSCEVDIGEIVDFTRLISWGRAVFEIRPSGAWTCDQPLPPSANHYYDIEDDETGMPTPDEFAREFARNFFYPHATDGEVCRVTVRVDEWSDGHHFRLVGFEDTAVMPRFVEVPR